MSYVNPVNKSYCLEQICESNYEKLLTLFPEIPLLNDTHIGHSKVASGLHRAGTENLNNAISENLLPFKVREDIRMDQKNDKKSKKKSLTCI